MVAKASKKKGFDQRFPTRAQQQLARRWSILNTRALAFLRRRLPSVVATQDPRQLEAMLSELDGELPGMLPDEHVEREAARTAKALDARHRQLFFAAVAASTGLALLNSDDPDERVPGLQVLAGGALGLAAGVALFGGPSAPVSTGKAVPSSGPVLPALVPTGGPVLVKVNTDPKLFADQFVAASTNRIKTLRAGVVEGVRDAVVREVTLGEGDPEELTARLLREWERKGVPSKIPTQRLNNAGDPVSVSVESHAAFTARDQLGTLNMELTRARQTAAGIEKFGWVTKGDSKVRDEHRDRNGKVYTWAEGANGEFPGGPPNCRCHAQAVVDPDEVRRSPEFVPLAG